MLVDAARPPARSPTTRTSPAAPRPVNTIDIRARVTGYLDKINFKDRKAGRREGHLLFEIDPRPYQAEVRPGQGQPAAGQAAPEAARARLSARAEAGRQRSRSAARSSTRSPATGPKPRPPIEVAKANLRPGQAQPQLHQGPRRSAAASAARSIDPGNLVKADDTDADHHRRRSIRSTPTSTSTSGTLLRIRRYIEEGRIKSATDERLAGR